jgi:hypothetical protein
VDYLVIIYAPQIKVSNVTVVSDLEGMWKEAHSNDGGKLITSQRLARDLNLGLPKYEA